MINYDSSLHTCTSTNPLCYNTVVNVTTAGTFKNLHRLKTL